MRWSVTLALVLSGCQVLSFISPNEYNEAWCDLDEDGDGDTKCGAGSSVAEGLGDCNDANPQMYHGNTEIAYDGLDNDCDGDLLLDVDGDSYPGISKEDFTALGTGEPWPSNLNYDVDCDDTNPEINKDATEIWHDGVDQDCAGDDDYDQDGDGHASRRKTPVDYDGDLPVDDCHDFEPQSYPGSPTADIWYDGIDNDCDGANDYDQDQDGWMDDRIDTVTEQNFLNYLSEYDYDYGYDFNDRTGDCLDTFATLQDDNNADVDPATVNPAATDPFYDGIDSNCDGADDYDQDVDGYFPIRAPSGPFAGQDVETHYVQYGLRYDLFGSDAAARTWYQDHYNDCVDTDATINPSSLEVFDDTTDQDCDGDEDTTPFGFGTFSDWEGTRQPVLGADDNHYILATATDSYVKTSSPNEDRGVYMYWSFGAERVDEPDAAKEWQGNAVSHPTMSDGYDVSFTGDGFVVTYAYEQGSSTYMQMREYTWNGTSAYNRSNAVNSPRPGTYRYDDMDLRYDDGSDYWYAVACSESGVHAILGDYSTGALDDPGLDVYSTSWTGTDCFFETPENVGGSTIYANFANGSSNSSAILGAGTLTSVSARWAGYQFVDTNSSGEWLVLGHVGGGVTVELDSSDSYFVLDDYDVLNADAIEYDGELYVLAAVSDIDGDRNNDLVLTFGNPAGTLQELQIPVYWREDFETTHTIDVESAGLYIDTERVFMAVVGSEGGTGYLGWSFMQAP